MTSQAKALFENKLTIDFNQLVIRSSIHRRGAEVAEVSQREEKKIVRKKRREKRER